jgi:hypothetical protein
MRLNLDTDIFDGYNNRDGILICGYEWGGDDDDSPQTEQPPATGTKCIFSNKTPFYGERWPWPYDARIIEWFALWGHPLSKEMGAFEKTIAQTNWCNTQNPNMQGQDYLKKLLAPEQVENFIYHIKTLQPRLILFFGSKLIEALQYPDALKPFEEIVGKLTLIDGENSIYLQKESKGRRFKIWFQNFEKCKIVCLPHPTGSHGLSYDYIAQFKDEIGSRIQEVKTLKGI